MDALRLACLALLAAVVLAGGAVEPNAIVAVVASTAALVAAHERRHRDMALAAGIAVGASSVGLALLPALVGTAVARKAATRLVNVAPAAIVTWLSIGWMPATDGSLVAIVPTDLFALLLATAAGTAAWIGAACAARAPLPRELEAAALLGCLALPVLAPIGTEAAGLAVALALCGARPSLHPLITASNDDPLPLRRA